MDETDGKGGLARKAHILMKNVWVSLNILFLEDTRGWDEGFLDVLEFYKMESGGI
jgi:hypothetical protein